MKNKALTPKFIALLAIGCSLLGVGGGMLGCHHFFKPEVAPGNWQPTKIEPTQEMVENIILYENGEQEVINPKSEDGKGVASLLTRTLHELSLQAKCVFTEEDIQRIKQEDKVAELFFKNPIDVTISQWVEPEERHHIPVDEKGYRILKNVNCALFILEDNLGEGLEAHVLVGHEVEGRIGYSCWAIQQEGSKELDKTWIDGLNRILGQAS